MNKRKPPNNQKKKETTTPLPTIVVQEFRIPTILLFMKEFV